jgi:hypothetical protein
MGPRQFVWQMVLCPGGIQNSERSGGSNPGSVSDVTLPGSPELWSIRTTTEATIERKMSAHIMMLWKYKPLNQDDALWP